MATNHTNQHKFRYDDSLDVFGVHGVGGFLGTILCGIFASSVFGGNNGESTDSIIDHLVTQSVGAVSAAIYAVIATIVILKFVQFTVGLRLTVHDEIRGLDLCEHDERGCILN